MATWLSTQERTARTQQQMREAVPSGRPDKELRWDPEKDEMSGKGVWQGAPGTGHAQLGDGQEWTERLADDPYDRVDTS